MFAAAFDCLLACLLVTMQSSAAIVDIETVGVCDLSGKNYTASTCNLYVHFFPCSLSMCSSLSVPLSVYSSISQYAILWLLFLFRGDNPGDQEVQNFSIYLSIYQCPVHKCLA